MNSTGRAPHSTISLRRSTCSRGEHPIGNADAGRSSGFPKRASQALAALREWGKLAHSAVGATFALVAERCTAIWRFADGVTLILTQHVREFGPNSDPEGRVLTELERLLKMRM